jgi:hypothetical protein
MGYRWFGEAVLRSGATADPHNKNNIPTIFGVAGKRQMISTDERQE